MIGCLFRFLEKLIATSLIVVKWAFLRRRVFFPSVPGCLEFTRSLIQAGFFFIIATNVFKQVDNKELLRNLKRKCQIDNRQISVRKSHDLKIFISKNRRRKTYISKFWNFCCSYQQIIAVWILVSKGREKKRRICRNELEQIFYLKK